MNIAHEYWIAGGLLGIGLMLFIILALRKSYRQPSLHETSGVGYKEARDEATLDDVEDVGEEEQEDEEESFSIANNMNITSNNMTGDAVTSMFGLPSLLSVVVGIVLLYVFMTQVVPQVQTTLVLVIAVLVIIATVLSFVIRVFMVEEKQPSRKQNKHKATRHYEGMRNELARRSTARDKAKAKSLRKESEE